MTQAILTINAGSSSIKFSIYRAGAEPAILGSGQVDAIGADATLAIAAIGADKRKKSIGQVDHGSALAAILDASNDLLDGAAVVGVGHRIVHGGPDLTAPVALDDGLMEKLAAYEPLAPLHQPHNLAGVRAAIAAFPDAAQVGCFDTAFHRGHPWVNDTFGLPRDYYAMGVRRYGFHGLSYDYVSGRLATIDPDLAAGRVVIAHLGNGASMCAIRHGKSVGSTMGFSALDGLPMGTRCGQLDPGVLLYLMDQKQMSAAAISDLLYRQSGLKGLSGLSNDMRELEASNEPAAAEAIDYFVFRIRRELGAMAAVLGGLDALVFCGGIGENSAMIRAQVCADMAWLGIECDDTANQENRADIGAGAVRVMIIPTDEEQVIARAVNAVL